MPITPVLRPCSPDPVCGPAPVPRLPSKPGWRQLAEAVGEGWRNWRAREGLYEEMCQLDHRELKDLGITRGDIPQFVAKTRRH